MLSLSTYSVNMPKLNEIHLRIYVIVCLFVFFEGVCGDFGQMF